MGTGCSAYWHPLPSHPVLKLGLGGIVDCSNHSRPGKQEAALEKPQVRLAPCQQISFGKALRTQCVPVPLIQSAPLPSSPCPATPPPLLFHCPLLYMLQHICFLHRHPQDGASLHPGTTLLQFCDSLHQWSVPSASTRRP